MAISAEWTREAFMSKIKIGNVTIIKEEDDPICPRISMGGNEEYGYYIVYRGELMTIKRILVLVNAAIEQL